jgi:peptidoglycan L-alanyl-D-glutamate endopeptidase CwlK
MSLQLFREDVLFYQRLLKANGFYKKELDGDWGKNTNAADASFVQTSIAIRTELGTYDQRSEDNILTLAPKVQRLARQFLAATKALNKDVRIISGTRTYSEQNALYAIGRTSQKTKSPVTNAKGGWSNHNFGLAWDIGIFNKGAYITKDADYIALANAVLPSLTNIEWGGNWKNFQDYPHYQHVAIDSRVSVIRGLFEVGNKYV